MPERSCGWGRWVIPGDVDAIGRVSPGYGTCSLTGLAGVPLLASPCYDDVTTPARTDRHYLPILCGAVHDHDFRRRRILRTNVPARKTPVLYGFRSPFRIKPPLFPHLLIVPRNKQSIRNNANRLFVAWHDYPLFAPILPTPLNPIAPTPHATTLSPKHAQKLARYPTSRASGEDLSEYAERAVVMEERTAMRARPTAVPNWAMVLKTAPARD